MVMTGKYASRFDLATKKNTKICYGSPSEQPFVNDRLELQLGDGRRATHRALLHLYRREALLVPNEPLEIHRAMQQRSGNHAGGAEASTRRAEKTKVRVQKAKDLKVGMKNNNQKHFRDQMLQ